VPDALVPDLLGVFGATLGKVSTQTAKAYREGADSMARLEREVRKTVNKATRGKKGAGGAKAEEKVRKAAKKRI
jgi:hypothetical protein